MEVGISGKDFAAEVKTAIARGAALDAPAAPSGRALSLGTVLAVAAIVALIGVAAATLHGAGRSQAASDARAKVDVRYAQTAIEVFALDHGGRYEGATVEELERIDASLPDGIRLTAGEDTYTVTVASSVGENRFSLTRNADGRSLSTCTAAGTGACPASGRWD